MSLPGRSTCHRRSIARVDSTRSGPRERDRSSPGVCRPVRVHTCDPGTLRSPGCSRQRCRPRPERSRPRRTARAPAGSSTARLRGIAAGPGRSSRRRGSTVVPGRSRQYGSARTGARSTRSRRCPRGSIDDAAPHCPNTCAAPAGMVRRTSTRPGIPAGRWPRRRRTAPCNWRCNQGHVVAGPCCRRRAVGTTPWSGRARTLHRRTQAWREAPSAVEVGQQASDQERELLGHIHAREELVRDAVLALHARVDHAQDLARTSQA